LTSEKKQTSSGIKPVPGLSTTRSPRKRSAVPQAQFFKLHLLKSVRALTLKNIKDLYPVRATQSTSLPILNGFIKALSLVNPVYDNFSTWRECIGVLKSKGSRVLTDLMLLPQKIVSGKADFEMIEEIKELVFGEKELSTVELHTYQRELREILKILINLV